MLIKNTCYISKKYNTGKIEYFAAWIICNDYADI